MSDAVRFTSGKKEFWSRNRVSFAEVPTLQDLLCVCDHRLLRRVLIEDFAGWRPGAAGMYGGVADEVGERIDAALDVMCSLEVSEDESSLDMLLPLCSFTLDSAYGAVFKHVDAVLVDLGKISSVVRVRPLLGGYACEYAQVEKAYEVLARAQLGLVGPKGCAFMPWDSLLATKVWLHASLCRKERYSVLASVFWEMTRLGFVREDAPGWTPAAPGDAYSQSVGYSMDEGAEEPPLDRCTADGEEDEWGSDPYGLSEPDGFNKDYRAKLAREVAIANHNSFLRFLDGQADVAARLGLAA